MQMKHVLLTPLVALMLAACGGDKANNASSSTAAPSPATTNSSNIIKVGIEPVYPPYVQPSATGGDFSGYDIDLLKAIAEKEGFQISFAPYPWTALFDRLNAGEVDIIAGGITVREERKTLIDFTDTYDESNMVALVPQDSPIKSINELNGKVVYYQKGSAEASTFQTMTNSTLNSNLGTESAWLSIKAVIDRESTKADAAVGQLSTFEYYQNQYKDQKLKIIYPENQTPEFMAFAVKKGNTALLEKLNAGLAKLKADGSLEKIHDKWSQHQMSVHTSYQTNTASAASTPSK